MKVSITNVHLDLGAGRRGTDMGSSAMHVAGLVPRIESLGHGVVDIRSIDTKSAEKRESGSPAARFLQEVTETCRALADRVEADVEAGRVPLVLGGDHSQAIGTITGLARAYRRRNERVGVLWVDAHTDMNTPETTESGNIHGMPLATLLGHGPEPLLALMEGDNPALRPEDVALVGIRDVDRSESSIVTRTGVRVYTMSELDARGIAVCVQEALARVTQHTAGVHLSFDLDGVDPQYAPGVGTPVAGGLTVRESHLICEYVARTGRMLAMEMVELNPTLDERNKTGELAVWLILSALGKTIL